MSKEDLLIPISIIIAGLLVAGGIYLGTGTTVGVQADGAAAADSASETAKAIRAVDETDHILGNPGASVTIIEYSDYQCPFCQRLHPTLERIVEESDGQVRWVYRHFPLTQIHSQAQRSAVAGECVAHFAGNDAFWSFSKTLLNNQSSLGDEYYIAQAAKLGVDGSAMETCLDSNEFAERVSADSQNAIAAGGRGTPFSVVIDAEGNAFPFSGALPYEYVKNIIDQALEG